MLKTLNLKNKYHLKKTQIELNPSTTENYEIQIKEKVIPAIIELESKGIINGFYFLLHSKIDLVISSDSWDKNEAKIKKILAQHHISDNLEEIIFQENEIPNLDNNSLEFTSRLRMAYILLKEKGKEQPAYNTMEKFSQLWIHYLYNQFGYFNYDEAIDHFKSGFGQLSVALKCKQCSKQDCIQLLEKLKKIADDHILSLKN